MKKYVNIDKFNKIVFELYIAYFTPNFRCSQTSNKKDKMNLVKALSLIEHTPQG